MLVCKNDRLIERKGADSTGSSLTNAGQFRKTLCVCGDLAVKSGAYHIGQSFKHKGSTIIAETLPYTQDFA